MIDQTVGCLHDYTLSVNDMKVLESADLILLNGAGLEDSMADALAASGTTRIDCAEAGEVTHLDACHVHDHGESTGVVSPQDDPHIWMDPMRACQMIQGIVKGLSGQDPAHAEAYAANGEAAVQALTAAYEDWSAQLADLTCRELITFHDGFAYFADAFDLTVLRSIEEESGSEASAQELAEIIAMVQEHQLPAVFTEVNGSAASAELISQETGVSVYTLDLLMSGPTEQAGIQTYIDGMAANINTIREAFS